VGLPAARVPSNDGGFIGIDPAFLRTRVAALSANNLKTSVTVSGTLSGLDTGKTANAWTPPPAATMRTEGASPPPAAPPASSSENSESSNKPTNVPVQDASADNAPFSAESDGNRPTDDHLTAIAPSDLAADEPEGGFIDLTGVADETARLERQTAAEPQVADGAAPAEEEWMLDGLRGRFQVFELAFVGSVADRETVLPLSQEATSSQTSAVRLTSLRPAAEHGASYRFRARDEAFADMAEEPTQHQASAENDTHWSLSRISLVGGAVIGLRVAERNAQAAMAADRQPVFVARTRRIG
jgi:hypothetical protein